jgi:hypothetical protein
MINVMLLYVWYYNCIYCPHRMDNFPWNFATLKCKNILKCYTGTRSMVESVGY